MVKAPIGKRILAFIIDSVLLMVLAGVFSIAVMVLGMGVAMINDALSALVVMMMFPAILVAIIVFMVRDGLSQGRGIGKKMMGLRVEKQGGTCTMKDSFMRNILMLAQVIPLIGFLVYLADLLYPFIDSEGLRLGDKIANTKVVGV